MSRDQHRSAIPPFALVLAAVGLASSAAPSRAADDDPQQDAAATGERAPPRGTPSRELGTMTVIGRRESSLPTQIPTTVEGIDREQLDLKINAVDAEDALKYFPSLLVRKRYVGDYDHAVLASRASGTGNSARSLVYADGILLSNLLGNGATFTPRWGLVTPEEIERVDVLYGPFSAAYPGNSVGAVVDYVTRMPTELEMHASVSTFTEDFEIYSTEGTFGGWQTSASVGDRNGNFSWWLSINRLDSDAHPVSFANKLVSSSAVDTAGTPVTGALPDRNPRNQDWLIVGSTTRTYTVQDHAKIKVAYDFTPTLRLSYTLGWWTNDSQRSSDTYLRDGAGAPVYNGSINVGGRRYTLTPADFAPSNGDLRHLMQGLSLKSGGGAWTWEASASAYDYDRDLTRQPTVALPAATVGGAGRITDQHGTGWTALALRATWRPREDAAHVVDMGVQRDSYELRTRVSDTADWLAAAPGALFSAFRGDTDLTSLYAQDTWAFAEGWRATLGARFERWQASNGAVSSATSTLPFAERSDTTVSPKAAIARQLNPDWTLKASLGRAFRNPTVAELYQGSISTNVIVNNDPNLEPEKSWTSELSGERKLADGLVRLTVFHESTDDALYSQTNVTVTPNVTNIQNVDEIDTTGLEVAYQSGGFLNDRLDLSASVTYAHSIIEKNDAFPASVGKWQPRVPEWRANAVATYRVGSQWSVTLGMRYSGTQYNTLDNSDPNGFTFTGNSPFLVYDARARYESRKWSASVGLDNVGNEEYWAFHPYTQRMLMVDVGFRL
ncbi:MAG TPA: TonB-dependent receptor [Gammaproteobacteria bacterium]|nr:TonB-dependent receptor [Gammaproteobacteria bacterium]